MLPVQCPFYTYTGQRGIQPRHGEQGKSLPCSNVHGAGSGKSLPLPDYINKEQQTMKKGQIYTGIVEKMEFPNKGVLYIDKEKVYRQTQIGI